MQKYSYDIAKQYSYDTQQSFVGGMVSDYDGNSLDTTQARLLQNCVIDAIGKVKKRPGIVEIGNGTALNKVQGLTYFDTPSVEKLIAISDGEVFENSGSGNWSSLAGYTTTNSDDKVRFSQLIDKLFVLDGTKHLAYWDGSTWTDNSTDTNPLGTGYKYLVSHVNRLFASGNSTVDDEIVVSQALDGANWLNINSTWGFRVGGGEGQAIKQIVSWYDTVLTVFKEQSVYVVETPYSATSAVNFSIRKVTDRGCVASESVKVIDNDILFLSDDGIRSLTQSQIADTNKGQVSGIISKPINDYILRINKDHVQKSVSEVMGDHYILWVPLDNNTEPSHALVWNSSLQSWVGIWTGWNASAMCISRFGDSRRLVVGDQSGDVSNSNMNVDDDEFTPDDYRDKGEAFTSIVRTRSMMFNSYINKKRGTKMFFTFGYRENFSRLITLRCYLDETDQYDLLIDGSIYETVDLPVSLPFDLASDTAKVYQIPREGLDANPIHFPWFNKIDFEVEIGDGDFEVQNIIGEAQVMSNV